MRWSTQDYEARRKGKMVSEAERLAIAIKRWWKENMHKFDDVPFFVELAKEVIGDWDKYE